MLAERRKSKYAGYILISDRLKEDSARAIAQLKKAGVTETIMLTADNRVLTSPTVEKAGF